MRKVYADNAATTAMKAEALDFMTTVLADVYGNPSSIHAVGREAARYLEKARETVAAAINCEAREVYFTSGGTEADNWAIRSAAKWGEKKGKKHIISTKIEHHAVLHALEAIEKEGFMVTYLDVSENGILRVEDVEKAVGKDTALVTVMYGNNEIGSIQPISEIGKLCREKGIMFHTDAVQAVGHVPIDVQAENIDMLSLSGHKFHGPKGVGALYCRKNVPINNLIFGGAQERKRRPGTENVPGIAAMAKALEIAGANLDKNSEKMTALRDRLIAGLSRIPRSRLNGDPVKRLPGNVNVCFEGIEGEALLLNLDLAGIAASSGSACTSGSLDPSHVLLAIGLPHEIAHGSLRLTISEDNSEEEIDYILEVLPPIVEKLRAMSPVWERLMEKEV